MNDPFRVMSITPVLNEENRIGEVVSGLPTDVIAIRLVVDDGSTDRTAEVARAAGATVISHVSTRGVGAAIRTGIHAAMEGGFDAVIITSGSGKTPTEQVPGLLKALVDRGLDFAQGSRYVPGGASGGYMPLQRRIGTRLYSVCFSLLVGRRVTDASSGFRAIRTRYLKDARLHLDQEWLDRYELEPYLLYKAISLGYRLQEVPVSIIYPPPIEGVPFTRMQAVVDWWRILRPAVYLRLGIKD